MDVGIIIILGGAFFLLAAYVYRMMLGWYTDGEISGSRFVVLSAAFFSGLIVFFLIPSFAAKVFVALLLVGSAIGAPILRARVLDKRDLQSFHNEQIEKYRNVIALRPDNVAARCMLAEELYKLGQIDAAIDELSEAHRLSPQPDTKKRLESLQKEREERGLITRPCPNCGHRNPADVGICPNCGGETRLSRAVVQSFGPAEVKRIVKGMCVATGLLAIPLFLFVQMTPVVRLIGICVVALILLIAALVHIFMEW